MQSIAWEAIKKQERLDKQEEGLRQENLLGGINQAMPSLSRAQKLHERASTVGFDWNDPQAVLEKIKEELREVEEEINLETPNTGKIEGEIGDLLFACVNLARHFRIDSESAVRRTNRKFEKRFAYIEHSLKDQGIELQETTLEIMDKLWDEAKTNE